MPINMSNDAHLFIVHQAAEALGAIGAERSVPLLERFAKDPTPEVSQVRRTQNIR